MKPLSLSEKEKILSRIYWDLDKEADELLERIDKISEEPFDLETINLCRRLLVSCDWYTLLKMVPAAKIDKMLSDSVIEGIYPKELITKFKYARNVLSK